jgi:hypothetical protein
MAGEASTRVKRTASRTSGRLPRVTPTPAAPEVAGIGGLAYLHQTIGNRGVARLVQGHLGRGGAAWSASLGGATQSGQRSPALEGTLQRIAALARSRPSVIQRYTEDDIRARAGKIYKQRIGARPPGKQTNAQRQTAAEADWAQAESDLKRIEARAREIAEDRKKNPAKYPKDAGPLSDWLQAEQEIDLQSNFDLISGGGVAEAGAPDKIALPKSLQVGMETAWKGSFPKGASQEQGGIMVKNKDGSYEYKAGKAGSSGTFSPNWGDKGKDQALVGSMHTHPYSEAEGGYEDVSFSGDDISTMIYTGEKVAFVQAGDTHFAVSTTAEWDAVLKPLNDKGKQKLSDQIEATWDKSQSAAGGTPQEGVEAAVKAVCTKYHLTYYRGKGGTLSKQ